MLMFREKDCYKYILLGLVMLPFLMMFNERIARNYEWLVFYSFFFFSLFFFIVHKIPVKLVIWLSMFSVFSLWTLIYTGGSFGSVAVPVVAICITYIVSQMEYVRKDYKILLLLCVLLLFFLFIRSFFFNMDDFRITDLALAKELINPNTFGLAVAFLYMVYVSLLNINTVEEKILCAVLFFVCIVALHNYQCRTAMVSLLFYVILCPFLEKYFSGRKLFWLAVLVVLAGFVLPYVYVEMSKEIPNFEIAGKNLYSGRQSIWLNTINAFEDYPLGLLTGLGSRADLWDGHDILNMHNSFLALLVNFGVVYTVLYFGFILKIIRYLCNFKLNVCEKKMILTFIAMAFVEGIAESTITSGKCIGIIFFVLGIVMSRVRYRFNLNHHFF